MNRLKAFFAGQVVLFKGLFSKVKIAPPPTEAELVEANREVLLKRAYDAWVFHQIINSYMVQRKMGRGARKKLWTEFHKSGKLQDEIFKNIIVDLQSGVEYKEVQEEEDGKLKDDKEHIGSVLAPESGERSRSYSAAGSVIEGRPSDELQGDLGSGRSSVGFN